LTADIDTARLSTRAWRQKGIDSVVTLISTLGGGTVLSVGSGYGTNFSTITTSGNVVVDSLVITSRASRDKLKDSLNANIALKVNISDTSTMLGAYLRKADTTSMLSPYLRKGDTTAMLSPYVRSAGYGLLKGTQTLSVDSATIATRARVQKGIDSVASLVAAPDSLLFSTRAWRQKGDDSLGAIIGTKATATGTTNYLSKFTGTSSLGNSIVYATTSEVGISTPSPTHPLDVNGRTRIRTIDSTATGMNMLYADVDGVIKKTAIPAGGSGTVTSVAAGTGMSFSTITTTGSVSADTVALSTRAWRQKGIDSVNANVALKVNISDTATMLSPYVRSAGFGLTKSSQSLLADSATMATRARVQKGIDSVASVRIGGSGTINRIPKFTASGTIGDGSIADSSSSVRMYIASGGNVGIGAATIPQAQLHVQNSAGTHTQIWGFTGFLGSYSYMRLSRSTVDGAFQFGTAQLGFSDITFATSQSSAEEFAERMRIKSNGEILMGTTTDAGDYRLQVAGSIYNTTGAVFAATSGNVGVGTTSPQQKMVVSNAGAEGFEFVPGTSNIIQSYNRSTSAFTPLVSRASIHNIQIGTDAALYIDASRNVGIGTTSPTFKLHLPGQSNTANQAMIAGVVFGSDGNGQTIKPSGSLALTIYGQNDQSYLYGASIGGEGRWGVGTTSPSYVFDVNGTMRSTGNTFLATTASNEVIVGGTTDAGAHTLQVIGNIYNTTGAVFAATSGNVGIGITPSAWASYGAPVIEMATGGTVIGAGSSFTTGQNWFYDGAFKYKISNAATYNIQSAGTHQWYTAPSGTANNTITFTQRMHLSEPGNLGVGTGSPSERLHVNGRARIATIDSSASPVNMLWADNDGVIRKAAVPAGGGGSADSAVFATRARVQKAVDSINNVNASGTGIANYITRWTGTKTMDTSQIIQVNGNIGIGTSSPGSNKLSVTGATLLNGNIITNATGGFGVYHQQVINETGMVIVSQRDPLGADTVVGAIGFGSNTHQAPARINAISAQAWDATNRGVYLSFRVTPNSNTQNYEMMRIQQDGEVVIGQNYADQGTYRLQVDGNTFTNGSIKTAAPAGGTSGQWKLGTRVASSVALDATQYIEVDIGGTLYYLATVSFLEPKPKP
jgi:hypothetical protein